MRLSKEIKEAEFTINEKLIVRFKKGYGYWLLRENDSLWEAVINGAVVNSLAIGFKEQYGFDFKTLKNRLFSTFEEALSYKDASFDYWEYNKDTHEKFMDTILKKGRFAQILEKMLDNKEDILNNIKNTYEK